MRFYSKTLLIFAAITVLFNSCKNDLNILAPYKESMSVYALLNPQEKRQYVRINKIYLGEGNAYTMATVNDSVNYPPGVLTVTLERFVNGVADLTTLGNPTKKLITLKDTVVQLKPGPFNTNQRLFYTDDKLFIWGDYKLSIKNNKTGNVFTSSTIMIDSIARPGIIQPIGFPNYDEVVAALQTSNPPSWYFLDWSVESVKRNISFVSVRNARDYAVTIRFHYIDSCTTGNINQQLDYNFPVVSSTDLEGGQNITLSFTSGEFFGYMLSKLNSNTPSNLLFRRAVKMDFIVTAAAQNFVDYLKISSPSTSVAQDKPAFTNIDGGAYGIFSVRSRHHTSKYLANATIDHISYYNPYCNLRFLKSDGTPAGVCF